MDGAIRATEHRVQLCKRADYNGLCEYGLCGESNCTHVLRHDQGITPTIIVVRVTMGTSFGERSRHAASTLRFNDIKSYPATSVTAASTGDMSSKTVNDASMGQVVDEYSDGPVAV